MAIADGDTVRWVSASQSLPYTIYFENDQEQATAAAQVVTVRFKLHPLMNMADLGIGTFGFGNHVFPVNGAPLQYQTRLDLTEEMNLYVDVVAGIDITTNEAFWIFSSIDPATGVAPTETDRGFLAVNDETHAGEGYVTFTIKPKANLCHTGDTIGAQASIVFDVNEAIETNRWVNTIDAVPPVSSCTVIDDTPLRPSDTSPNLGEELDSLRVVFSGADDATGMAAYRLYYTENGSSFRLAGRYTAGDTAVIAKQPNTTYTFFSLGEDKVGNIEPMKGEPDTLFGNTSVRLLASVRPDGAGILSGAGSYSLGDTANISILPAEGYRMLRWTEGGVPQGTDTLLTIVADENHTFTAELERISYPLTVNAVEGTTITATTNNTPIYQEVRHFDTLDIHIEASPCYGEVLFSLNNNPLTADTTIVVHEAITLTSTATQQVDTGYVFDTVCRNTAYTANGFNILSSATGASGTFNFQLPTLNLNGCDSIACLSLFVKPSHTLTFLANGGDGTMPTQQVCDGEESVLIGSTFTREGFFFAGWATSEDADTTQYADGGIITLTGDQTLYAVWSSDCVDRESNRMVTVCDSYMWNGEVQAESGDYMRTVSAVVPGGCDSIYRLHLTVKHSTENLYQIISCQPYTWVDGQTYNVDTTRQLSMTNSVGCDSLVTLQLTIAEDYFSTESISACDSYMWHDVEYTTSVDDPTFTIHGNHGCDSTFTLNLTILQSNTGTETVTVCDSYTWIDGNVYVASNDTAQHTLNAANVFGCDSTVTLNLTINYSTETTETDTAEGSYIWNGTTYTESGTYQWQGLTEAGCDSIVTLVLVVNQVRIEEMDGSDISVMVYPNPTTGWITIDAEDILSVEVFDQSGRKVASYEQTNRINLLGLSAGSYLLKIHLQRGSSLHRVILN